MVYDYLPLDQHSKKPLYQQLYEQIRRAVQEGHLSQGEKMPSIRKLAEDLELSRTTIEAAYQQLCVEGYLKSRKAAILSPLPVKAVFTFGESQ